MNNYMVTIALPPNPDEEFFSLIPLQRAQVDGLMNVGVIGSYSLSVDRTELWISISAESEKKVHQIVEKFPMRKYMDVRITELMFHNTLAHSLPQTSLN